jgi:hypothetical protein
MSISPSQSVSFTLQHIEIAFIRNLADAAGKHVPCCHAGGEVPTHPSLANSSLIRRVESTSHLIGIVL